MNITNLAFACAMAAACVSPVAGQEPVNVALFVGGDDGETQRLAEALRQGLRSSARYRLATADERPGVVVTVVDHVAPVLEAGIRHVRYEVTFSQPGGAELGRKIGSCQSRRMNDCASGIFQELDRTLRSEADGGARASAGSEAGRPGQFIAERRYAACVNTSERISLSGRVQYETVFGPPSFGENPGRDERRSIAVLLLDRPINVCRGLESEMDTTPISGVRATQLIYRRNDNRITPGRTSITGVLQRATNAFHHTPVTLIVEAPR